jgi:organic hydroperoxide reductase OsmC/OhrA
MMGTFAAMLAKERIATPAERYQAAVTGDIEAVGGVLKIVRINVSYRLKAPEEKRAAAHDAFEVYLPFCPAASSVSGAIEVKHELTFETI